MEEWRPRCSRTLLDSLVRLVITVYVVLTRSFCGPTTLKLHHNITIGDLFILLINSFVYVILLTCGEFSG